MNLESPEYAAVLTDAREALTKALATGLVPEPLIECITTFLVTGTMVKRATNTPYHKIGSVQRETETLTNVLKWYLWRDEPPNGFDLHQTSTSIRALNAALAHHYAQAHAPALQTH